MTTRIAVLGATGYTALELLIILSRHPESEVVLATSRRTDAPHLADVHPRLRGLYDLRLSNLDLNAMAGQVDFVFSCLPHAASAESVCPLVDAGMKVVDFSADYRLHDAGVYEKWYGGPHSDPDRLGSVPYGLPELFRDEIRQANLVANPGCYPTSAILPLAPLLEAEVISGEDIIIDSKSGITGAGRSPAMPFHYPEANENFKAYNVGQHRHEPEISQFCTLASGEEVKVIFTPHLAPMNRGILSTCYVRSCEGKDRADAMQVLQEFYQDEFFVRILDKVPETKDVTGTNYCDISVASGNGRLVVISVLDNIVKGAAGAAVQNFNLMCGHEEHTGLV